MLKLLDCNNFWSPSGGGVRRYHLEKMDYFKSRSDVHYIFVMHDNKTYTEQINDHTYVEHIEVPKVWGNWEYRYLIRKWPMARVILEHQPDIIEVGSPYFMPRIIHSIVKRNKLQSKVFGFWHADFPVTYARRFLKNTPLGLANRGEQLAWWYARKHYNRMDGVLVASEVIKMRMERNGMNNLHFTPLGVNNELFHPDKRNTGLITDLKAGNPERLILFFPHRFSKEKGLHVLLRAYEMILEMLDVPPALVLAGTGPYEKLVKEAAAKYKHVHFKGFIENKREMAEYYASSDLGFALSEWETFGLSLVEALSSGLSLIVAGEGAAREHVESSKAGLILDEVNPDQLADAIVRFSKLDRYKLSENARKYAAQLSWESCFDRQLDIYQRAIEVNKRMVH
ncbi:glycosyltransferase [Ekhidna sp.]|jgi:alpha-1,6-mannosyltransferase|uniref:glycosyltransferase n=1 Tax=Ekhidna sp. TaxID=2608089 RepID=UPI0032EBD6E0